MDRNVGSKTFLLREVSSATFSRLNIWPEYIVDRLSLLKATANTAYREKTSYKQGESACKSIPLRHAEVQVFGHTKQDNYRPPYLHHKQCSRYVIAAKIEKSWLKKNYDFGACSGASKLALLERILIRSIGPGGTGMTAVKLLAAPGRW